MLGIIRKGRLGADAELRYTPSGDPVLNFRVAENIGYGDKKSTSWWGCTVWGKRATGLHNLLKRGTQVTITGEVSIREWTDKENKKRSSTEMFCDQVEIFNTQKQEETQPELTSEMIPSGDFDMMDDLPF